MTTDIPRTACSWIQRFGKCYRFNIQFKYNLVISAAVGIITASTLKIYELKGFRLRHLQFCPALPERPAQRRKCENLKELEC